jgi:hypothetical protein
MMKQKRYGEAAEARQGEAVEAGQSGNGMKL